MLFISVIKISLQYVAQRTGIRVGWRKDWYLSLRISPFVDQVN